MTPRRRSQPIKIRPIEPGELDAFFRNASRAIGFPMFSQERLEFIRSRYHYPRTLAAFDGETMVASAHSYPFELTVPGNAIVPAAGVTMVGVAATHRRRGILTSLMRRQLTEAKDRGEPAAILLASESIIYGRFGYGLATSVSEIEIDAKFGAFEKDFVDGGSLRFIDDDTADKVLPDIWERHRRKQPGAIGRDEYWWDMFRDQRRPGAETIVIHESRSGEPDGYARYRVNMGWDAGLPNHSLHLNEMATCTDEATIALWKHLLGVDLVRSVQSSARPVDEPLRWLLADPRRVKVTAQRDFLWARPLDIPACLSARSYLADGRLVLDVTDGTFPDNDGIYELVVNEGAGRCRHRSKGRADLAMPVSSLGAVWLGGVTVTELVGAGRVTELRKGAAVRADAMFACRPRPWCQTGF